MSSLSRKTCLLSTCFPPIPPISDGNTLMQVHSKQTGVIIPFHNCLFAGRCLCLHLCWGLMPMMCFLLGTSRWSFCILRDTSSQPHTTLGWLLLYCHHHTVSSAYFPGSSLFCHWESLFLKPSSALPLPVLQYSVIPPCPCSNQGKFSQRGNPTALTMLLEVQIFQLLLFQKEDTVL